MFVDSKIIKWDDKADMEKMWATCKSYFKELYMENKRYNKATGKNPVSKARRTLERKT